MATLANKRVRKKKESSISWSDLPNELLESIKKRLFYIDQLNFRAVCKSWSSIQEGERLIPPLQQMPWLLIYQCVSDEIYFEETYFDYEETYSDGKTYSDVSWLLIDPKYKKEYKVDTKVIQQKMNISQDRRSNRIQCHESKCGWLLISSLNSDTRFTYCYRKSNSNTTGLFLYSPFLDDNNNCIELPILSTDFCMATFTSNPLDDDCTVITLNTSCQVDSIVIHTYRRGHSSWNSLVFKCDQFSPRHVKCWIYTDEGLFYYVINDGRVGTFDMTREEWNVFPPLPTTMEATLQTLLRDTWVKVYIIKSGEGELFLISECNFINQRDSQWRYDGQYIFRLDLSSMIWKDLNSIGEHVLFIGNGYKAVMNSSVLKTKRDRKEISNMIYCCSKWRLKHCTVHDYTLRETDNGYPRRQHCSKHYGDSAIISGNGSKLLIDPPLPRRPRTLVKPDGRGELSLVGDAG